MWDGQPLQKFVRIEFLLLLPYLPSPTLPSSSLLRLLSSPYIFLSLPLFLPFPPTPISLFPSK